MEVFDISKEYSTAVKQTISDSLKQVFKTCLPFHQDCKVEGLLAVTVDNKTVFLVNVNEYIEKDSLNKHTQNDHHGSNKRNGRKTKTVPGLGSEEELLNWYNNPQVFQLGALANQPFPRSFASSNILSKNIGQYATSKNILEESCIKLRPVTSVQSSAAPASVQTTKAVQSGPMAVDHTRSVPIKNEIHEVFQCSDQNDNQLGIPSLNYPQRSNVIPQNASKPTLENGLQQVVLDDNLAESTSVLETRSADQQLSEDNQRASVSPPRENTPSSEHKHNKRKSKVPKKVAAEDEWLAENMLTSAESGTYLADPAVTGESQFYNGVAASAPVYPEGTEIEIVEPTAAPIEIKPELPQLPPPATRGRKPRKRRGRGTVLDPTLHGARPRLFCEQCNKKFTSKEGWKIHMEKHDGISRYTCKYCGKGFSASTHLKGHMYMHTKDPGFICEVCGEGFQYCFGKIKHLERVHNIFSKNVSRKRKKSLVGTALNQKTPT